MGRNLDEFQKVIVDAVTMYLEQLMLSQQGVCDLAVRKVATAPNDNFTDIDFFRTDQEPAITLRAYVERTVAYMRCTPECYVFAVAYLRRAADRGFPLHLRTIHRLYMTALTIAAKVRDDLYYSMSYYGQIGGVSARDLGRMELRFLLSIISFEANVSKEEYAAVCSEVGKVLFLENRLQSPTPPLSFPRNAIAPVASEGGLSSCMGSPTTSPATQPLLAPRQDRPEDFDDCAWTVRCNMFYPLLA